VVDFAALTFHSARAISADMSHEYVVRTVQNQAAYLELFERIWREGERRRFGSRRYKCWRHDGYDYWATTDNPSRSEVINRAKVDPDEFLLD
jgi:hypothetical protein